MNYRNVCFGMIGDNYLMINRKILSALGLVPAVFISELIDKHRYCVNQLKNPDDWFYASRENIEKNTTITIDLQKKICKMLEENGYIETKMTGAPPKKYYKINYEKLVELLSSDENCKKNEKKLESKAEIADIEEDEKELFDEKNEEKIDVLPVNNLLTTPLIDKKVNAHSVRIPPINRCKIRRLIGEKSAEYKEEQINNNRLIKTEYTITGLPIKGFLKNREDSQGKPADFFYKYRTAVFFKSRGSPEYK